MIGGPGELLHGLEALGIALHAEAVDVPFEIVVMHFEEVGGDHLRLGLDLARGHGGGGARDRRRARAVGAEAIGRGVGVALLDGDVVGRQAEFGGDDLGVGRLVALALRLGAEAGDHRAGRMDADLGGIEHGDAEDVAVLRRAGADDLGEEGDADAHQFARLAALEGFLLRLLLGAELAVADRVHRLLQGGVIVAGIVFPAERRGVGELLALDEVLHPELGRVHAELLGQDVHRPLDAIGGLGDAERAAIGDAARRLVGVDAVDRAMRDREIVGAGDDVEEARPAISMGRRRRRRRRGRRARGRAAPVTLPSLVAAISVVMW